MTEQSVEVLYTKAQDKFTFLEDYPTNKEDYATLLNEAIYFWEFCDLEVRKQSIFSKNEELDDINTESLRYLLCHFYLAKLHQKFMDKRLEHLKHSRIYYLSYLELMKQIKLLSDDDNKYLKEYVEKKNVGSDTDNRNRKINRYKVEKEYQQRMNYLKSIENKEYYDEDLKRENYLLILKSSINQSLDDIGLIHQEIEILKHMNKLKDEGIEPPLPEPVPQHQGFDIYHISAANIITKEHFKAGVFKPDHLLPTMTIEEFGEIELQHMKEREARQKDAEKDYIMDTSQVYEKHLEDNEELIDKATMKDRYWDDWKDENVKGFGNTKKM